MFHVPYNDVFRDKVHMYEIDIWLMTCCMDKQDKKNPRHPEVHFLTANYHKTEVIK